MICIKTPVLKRLAVLIILAAPLAVYAQSNAQPDKAIYVPEKSKDDIASERMQKSDQKAALKIEPAKTPVYQKAELKIIPVNTPVTAQPAENTSMQIIEGVPEKKIQQKAGEKNQQAKPKEEK